MLTVLKVCMTILRTQGIAAGAHLGFLEGRGPKFEMGVNL